jgi:hypothetical protein
LLFGLAVAAKRFRSGHIVVDMSDAGKGTLSVPAAEQRIVRNQDASTNKCFNGCQAGVIARIARLDGAIQ